MTDTPRRPNASSHGNCPQEDARQPQKTGLARTANPAHTSACGNDTDAAHAGGIPDGEQRSISARYLFKVHGLDCADEVAILKHEIGPLVGGEDHLAFDVLNGRMSVLDTARQINPDDIRSAVARTGMTAEDWRAADRTPDASDRHRRHQAWFTALSGLFLLFGFFDHVVLAGGVMNALRLFGGHGGAAMPWPEAAAYGLAIAFGIRFVLPKAWFSARRLRPDMNLLMVVAITGAIAIGELFEAATVAFLFALSLALEGWSVGRARRAISALLDLAPPLARVLGHDGAERDLPVSEVAQGSHFIVYPGARVPLDGRIVKGTSSVNQAPITGESIPVEKNTGSELFAGTINGDGVLEAISTKRAEDTTLSRIITLVEDAHSRRAQIEHWVERFAAIYTPAAIVLAIAVALLPPLLFGLAWIDWFYRALVLLVIACPCALVISTPVSIVSALAAAARNGVLIKGGVFIEVPARLGALALDKTGTITHGAPRLTDIVALNGHTEDELLTRAAALEARSTHPLARAILARAEARGLKGPAATQVQMLRGKGITGRIQDEPFWLGSHRLLIERGQDEPRILQLAHDLERAGKTVVVIGNTRHVCGLLAIADTARPGAASAIARLRRSGVAHIVMLTGDNLATAQAVAADVGIDEVRAELLPQDKLSEISRLSERYGAVAMVGDGVNDAPAMARASLGIAMGAAGSDAAIETADIALMTDDLEKLPWLVRHSKRTMRVIRQNITFALCVKAAFVILTFLGLATLWGAIAADVGASLLVVFNGLRLLRSHDAASELVPGA